MGNWLSGISICLVLSAQGVVLGDEANWQHDMDTALQAAARQNYSRAEAAFVMAVKELELVNANDPRLGPTINSLGLVYRAENKLADAEQAFRRAAQFIDKTNAPLSIDVANSNMNIGSVLNAEGKYNLAEPFLLKALKIYQTQLGNNSPKTAKVMSDLGETYRNLHDNGHAEPMLKGALDVQEASRGIDDPDVATTVNSLAELYESEKQMEKAEPYFKLVMGIRESTAGMDSPEFATAVERYAAILEKIGRFQDAERHKRLAAAVRMMIAKKTGTAAPPAAKAIDVAPASPRSASGLPMKGNQVARIQ
jgi:tetratricopeptide (TPR) repeat protein